MANNRLYLVCEECMECELIMKMCSGSDAYELTKNIDKVNDFLDKHALCFFDVYNKSDEAEKHGFHGYMPVFMDETRILKKYKMIDGENRLEIREKTEMDFLEDEKKRLYKELLGK
jgi:hypothetical protein